MKKLVIRSCFMLILAALVDRASAQTPKPVFFTSNVLPPPNGMYISPGQWHALYANGIIVTNVIHRAFTESLPPPVTGASTTHAFGSELDFDLSLNNGATFTHVIAPATMAVNVQAVGTGANGQQIYATEMLQLNVSGGTLPAGVQFRASPAFPSGGQTTVSSTPGGYLITSFFDVFTDVSLDGGQSWSPPTQSGHVELRADPTLITPVPQPTGLVPPPSDEYVSPAQYHALFAAGVIIKDVRHKFFDQALNLQLVPVGTNKVTEHFGSTVDFALSMDGGQTFTQLRAPATVSVTLQGVAAGPPVIFDAEMTQLDVTIAGLPTPLRLRESPTLSSYGETAFQQMADGTFRINSFFDIFTELSMDGGQTWQASATGPAHVELQRAALLNRFLVPNLPPTNGQFNVPVLIQYPGGVVVNNLVTRNMSPSLPLPPPGQSQLQEFSATVDLMLSLNNGGTFTPASAPAIGLVVVSNTAAAGAVGPQYFNTELLQMNISGGTLPQGLMLRESPTKASLGRASSAQDALAGGFRISSFFDVFTELTLDAGRTWLPSATDPTRIPLVPNPPFAPYLITCPPDITIFSGSSSGGLVNYSLPPIVFFPDCPFCCFAATCVPPSGSIFPLGTTTVHCTGSDGCGEHPTCSFHVTVFQSFIFSGLFNTGLGSAKLSHLPSGSGSFMVVSNLGPSGLDGFHLNLGAADSVLLNFLPFPTTYNTCIIVQGTSPYAVATNHVLGIGTYFGGTNPLIRADFAALNATSVTLEVTDENNHLISSSHVPNAAWVQVNPLFPPCTNTTTVYSYGQTADHICYRFCKYGCNCLGTNCYFERIVCFRPDIADLPLGTYLTALDVYSQGATVPSTLTIQNEDLGMFGVQHEAKGQATLETHPGLLLVNDIGSSGQDGLAVNLNHAGQLDLTLAPTRLLSQGACWKMAAFGGFNGTPNVALGTASLTASVGPGGGCDVSVDFDGIGAAKTRVDVYQGSQFVGSTILSNGVLGTLHPNGNLIGCGKLPVATPCFWLRFDSPFLFLATTGSQFVGDQIRLLAANPTGQQQGLSQFCLQACNIGQFAILGAAVSPTIGGIYRRSDGRFEIDGHGLAGVNYRLEGTSKLGLPLQWTPVSSALSELDGSFHLLDSRPAPPDQQFYHVVTP